MVTCNAESKYGLYIGINLLFWFFRFQVNARFLGKTRQSSFSRSSSLSLTTQIFYIVPSYASSMLEIGGYFSQNKFAESAL